MILGVVNLLMVSHAVETFRYEFDGGERNFKKHIVRLVGASILYNFEKPACVYLRIFPWRLRGNEHFERETPYTLERSTLLFFVLLETNFDLFLFLTVRWVPFLSPWMSWRRYIRYYVDNNPKEWNKGCWYFIWITVGEYFTIVLLVVAGVVQPIRVLEVVKRVYRLKRYLV